MAYQLSLRSKIPSGDAAKPTLIHRMKIIFV